MKEITFDISEMIALRLEDPVKWSYSELGRKFHKDHTTIMYHCHRLGIMTFAKNRNVLTDELKEEILRREVVISQQKELHKPKKIYKYAHLLEEEVRNPGKSYKEYLADALKRPIEKRYHDIYYGKYDAPHVPHNLASLATVLEEEARSEPDPIDTKMV